MTQDHLDVTTAVAPSKPSTPRTPATDRLPEPIEVEDVDDVAAPHPAPPAEEILPTARSPFEAADELEETTAEPRTAVQLLGAAAAANASLSARGAPTPLGGIPVVGPAGTADQISFDEVMPAFQPRFAPVTVARDPRIIPAMDGMATGEDDAPVSPASPAEPAEPAEPGGGTFANEPALYRPRVAPGEQDPGVPGELADDDGDAPQAPGTDAGPAEAREPGRAWPLIIVGVLILAGIGFALSWSLLRPDPIELPAQSVIAEPAEQTPAVEPLTLEDPTPFLAAMPTVAGRWALTAVVTGDPLTDDALPGRVAEVHTLTYEDGSAAVTLVARQLYSDEDALAALGAEAGEDAPIVDATVAGTVVGSRSERSSADSTRIMWTNGSAYFEAVGPTAAVTELVEVLGL